ncbi:hypothetical protein F66182_1556 [Fusarium sp. NRRL 66182]|nr:hypothetical protein F66182_1556 [Fusarium sp. NRRL 66182]
MKETADGHGLFASSLIRAGVRIIREKAIISVSHGEIRSKPEYMCVISQISQLSPDKKNRLLSLYHNEKKLHEFSFLKGRPCPGTDLDSSLVLAKFYTNAANLSAKGLECGLFTEFCRMNHSCTPNTCWVYDEPLGMMEVYTVKDIHADQEITNSYIEVACSRQSRAKELSNWGFACSCAACKGPDAAEHDERRRRIVQLRELLDIYQDSGKNGEKPRFAQVPKTDFEALRLGQEMVDLLLAEELVEQLGMAYESCAKFAHSSGLHDLADSYEEKEYEVLVLTTGEYVG